MSNQGDIVTLSPAIEQFPTAVIVAIAVGGWVFLVIIALIVRKIVQDKGYCNKFCDSFQCCTGCRASAASCFMSFAQTCDFKLPSKQGVADLFCPNPEDAAMAVVMAVAMAVAMGAAMDAVQAAAIPTAVNAHVKYRAVMLSIASAVK
ncbi:uncharacterized protein TRIADDRAFT_59183 [Trichoplax adhaerens]|uniref:Uncharacterized protein n=1 Tax=Trichoplax adhaerens TaxID=10228 RepID=B3S537_TRIAD|nr:predicted protein [Trichoplax adhaerens]EDV22196.1 predicted protein [Trichoplax adhaerens]|eukprot:XP_002115351.1 predicted protein [Trichoplax adhaerens]